MKGAATFDTAQLSYGRSYYVKVNIEETVVCAARIMLRFNLVQWDQCQIHVGSGNLRRVLHMPLHKVSNQPFAFL